MNHIEFSENGFSGEVYYLFKGSVTIALVVLDGAKPKRNHGDPQYIYGGTAFWNPADTYDPMKGLRVAVANALKIGQHDFWDGDNAARERAIHSAIRTALRKYSFNPLQLTPAVVEPPIFDDGCCTEVPPGQV